MTPGAPGAGVMAQGWRQRYIPMSRVRLSGANEPPPRAAERDGTGARTGARERLAGRLLRPQSRRDLALADGPEGVALTFGYGGPGKIFEVDHNGSS